MAQCRSTHQTSTAHNPRIRREPGSDDRRFSGGPWAPSAATLVRFV